LHPTTYSTESKMTTTGATKSTISQVTGARTLLSPEWKSEHVSCTMGYQDRGMIYPRIYPDLMDKGFVPTFVMDCIELLGQIITDIESVVP